MAFTSITLDGYGMYANCDSLADTAGGDWTEDGGGTVTYEVTDPLVGSGSIGCEYASKEGHIIFTSDYTLDFAGTGTDINVANQLIGIWIKIASNSAFESMANNGLEFFVGTDNSNYRAFKLNAYDNANGWYTGYKYFVFDINNVGDASNDVGTFDIEAIKVMGLHIDTIVSVRAPTIFIDQIMVYNGIRVKGTGTLDEIVAYCTDFTSRAWGTFQEREGIYFSYGKLFVADNTTATEATTLSDDGNVVQYGISEYYHDTNGWSLTHQADYNEITLEKHASYDTTYSSANTALFGSVDAKLAITYDAGAILDLTGGALKTVSALTLQSGDTLENKVLTDIDASDISNTPLGCTFNTSGQILLQTGGGLDSCVVNESTVGLNDGAVKGPTSSAVVDTHFISDGSGHAFETTGSTDQNWENTQEGYGNDDTTDAVFYNNGGSDIQLNVINNGVSPTVRTVANTTVVSGTITVRVIITDLATGNPLEGVRVHVTKDVGGATVLSGTTDASGIIEDTGYSYTADEDISGKARFNRANVYKTGNLSGTIISTGVTMTQSLIADE